MLRTVSLFCLTALLFGCSDDTPPPDTTPPVPPAATALGGDGVLDLAVVNPSLETFSDAIDATALEETLRTEGPFTVFAPSDAAFDAAGEDVMSDPVALTDRLRGLVIPTRMLSIDVFAPIEIETLGGTMIEIDSPAEGQVVVRSGGVTATVVDADLDASNGVIHIIDILL